MDSNLAVSENQNKLGCPAAYFPRAQCRIATPTWEVLFNSGFTFLALVGEGRLELRVRTAVLYSTQKSWGLKARKAYPIPMRGCERLYLRWPTRFECLDTSVGICMNMDVSQEESQPFREVRMSTRSGSS